MATKKDYTLLYVAGAGALAYLIFHKPPPVQPLAQSPQTLFPKDVLSQGLAVFKNLFTTAPASPLPAPAPLAPVQVAPAPAINIPITSTPSITVPTISPDPANTSDIVPTPYAYDQETLAGFGPLSPAGMAAMGLGCVCASALPSKSIGKFDWSSLIVPGVVIAGGYLLIKNLGLFGGSASVNNSAIQSQTSAANNKGYSDAISQGFQQTLSDSQINSLSTDIYNQGLSFTGSISSRAMDQMVKDFQQLQTIADVYALKKAFGVKELPTSFWSTCQWLNFNCTAMDLDTFVKLNLDADHLSQLNAALQAHGINYQL